MAGCGTTPQRAFSGVQVQRQCGCIHTGIPPGRLRGRAWKGCEHYFSQGQSEALVVYAATFSHSLPFSS